MIKRENIDDFGRVYHGKKGMYPSVTTIVDQAWQEGDDYHWWKQKNDGNNGNPYHKDIKNYSGWRGTLCHYTLLNTLTHEELWSDEEQEAIDNLKEMGDYKYDADEEPKDAYERYQRDLQWVKRQFDLIQEKKGIKPDNVVDVERRVLKHEFPRYAGQFDLLYENPSGQLVLSDLKTSKWIYDKNKLQLAAYANAIDEEPDVLEVIKIHPEYEWVKADDYQPIAVESSEEWDESIDELCETFLERAVEGNQVLERRSSSE